MERAVVLITVLFVASFAASQSVQLAAQLPADPSASPAVSRVESPPGDEKALKALAAWVKAYRGGKIDLKSPKDLGKDSIAEKFGVMPKGVIGTFTAARELEALLEQTVALQTPAAAEAVLEVAAIGLDSKLGLKPLAEPTPGRLVAEPSAPRLAAERAAAKFTAPAALEHVVKIARGEVKTDANYGLGVRAAALRQFGLRRDDSGRELLEQQLRAPELPLRLAAVETLGQLGDERSGEALAAILATETHSSVVGAVAVSLRSCYQKYLMPAAAAAPARGEKDKAGEGKPGDTKPPSGETADGKPEDKPGEAADKPSDAKPAQPTAIPAAGSAAAAPTPMTESVQQSLRAVSAAIGRTHWRADIALIDLLREFRAIAATPALIDVLQRFKDHPEQVQTGALSSLLLHRAHEALVALTGAVFPADAPQKWREFWQQEQQKLTAAPPPAKPKAKAGDTVAGFCGIPVEGSRVLIIIDLSGSMEFAMPLRPGDTESKSSKIHTSRLAFAKVQLAKLVNELPEWSKFNFITFNGRDNAESWQKELVTASKKNKDQAVVWIAGDGSEKNKGLKATYQNPRDGGTNMWAGLEAGLQYLRSKSLVHGQRDEAAVDEMFVVSDGAPTVGSITDPLEILTLVTEANRFAQVRINTIYITSPNDQNPKNPSLSTNELMRRMAEQNGGTFVEFSN